jgi:hypothetical protein
MLSCKSNAHDDIFPTNITQQYKKISFRMGKFYVAVLATVYTKSWK